jgi:hypothetical protein
MLSNRLAMLAVAAGTALLGFSSAGVTAIAGDVPAASTQLAEPHHHDHHHGHDGDRGL